MANNKNKNVFAKRKREAEKKRKADAKRAKRQNKGASPDDGDNADLPPGEPATS